MTTLDIRLRTLEAKCRPAAVGNCWDTRLRTPEAKLQRMALLAGASLVESEVSGLVAAHHADRGAYLAGLLQRMEDGATRPDDSADLRSLASLRIVWRGPAP